MRPRSSFLLLSLLLALAGCASIPGAKLDEALTRGDHAAALSLVEGSEKAYGKNSRLLWLMDRGMALQLAGRLEESVKAFDQANQLAEELYTKSLSREALAFATNEGARDYEGEDFERVMVNVMAMVGYTFMGDAEGAMVEARRADQKLADYEARYAGKRVYREDPLARYLAAMLREQAGEWDAAFLDYRKAREGFRQVSEIAGTPEPPYLGADLLRAAEAAGFTDRVEELRKEYPQARWFKAGALKAWGEAVILVYDGRAPYKVDRFITVPVGSLYFKMAFPNFQLKPVRVQGGRLESMRGGATPAPLALIEDLAKLADADLKAHNGRIKAKAIARATAKFVAGMKIQEEAKKSGNVAAELLAFVGTNAYNLATEEADKRSWRSLPGRIHLARLPLPQGTHDLLLRVDTPEGERVREFRGVKVEAGRKAFLKAVIP